MADAAARDGYLTTNGPANTRVLIVDDHELVRGGITKLLANHRTLEVCGEASGEDAGMQLVRSSHPNVVIVDIVLAQGDGLHLIKRITAHDKSIRTIVCSMHEEGLYFERALRAGASGYVHKQAPAGTLLDAIAMVLAGDVYVSPRTVETYRERIKTKLNLDNASALNRRAVQWVLDNE